MYIGCSDMNSIGVVYSHRSRLLYWWVNEMLSSIESHQTMKSSSIESTYVQKVFTKAAESLIKEYLRMAQKLGEDSAYCFWLRLLRDELSEPSADLVRFIDKQRMPRSANLCHQCKKHVEGECAVFMDKRWHFECLKCSRCSERFGENPEGARWCDDRCIRCDLHRTPDAIGGFVREYELKQDIICLQVAHARMAEAILKDKEIQSGSEGLR